MPTRLALLAFLLLAGCAGWCPPVDVRARGSEHYLNWWLGLPF